MIQIGDLEITGKNLEISSGFNIKTRALAGQSSSTARSDEGIEPATITVKFLIEYEDKEFLKKVTSIAKALNEDQSTVVYDVVCDLSEAMDIKQVQFSKHFRVAPASETLLAWQVSFTLVEYNSTSEKEEVRKDSPIAKNPVSTGVLKPVNSQENSYVVENLIKYHSKFGFDI